MLKSDLHAHGVSWSIFSSLYVLTFLVDVEVIAEFKFNVFLY
jgi:hypothetical protein